MAGFLVKIVIEDTHPPVWRRLLIPEKINFADLHEIIRIAFDWRQICWHDFTFPRRNMRIFSDGDAWELGRNEKEALVDEYIEQCTFIRYTFDDDGENYVKIILEKKDTEYGERFAKLIKAKGDESSAADVNERLARLKLPERTSAVSEGMEWDFGACLDSFLQRAMKKKELNPQMFLDFESVLENLKNVEEKQDVFPEEISEIGSMTEVWQNLAEKCGGGEEGTISHLVKNMVITKRTSGRTSFEMLGKLNRREAADYYKYLRLAEPIPDTREGQIEKIGSFLRENPMYYLWHMNTDEAETFLKICRQADGPVKHDFCMSVFCYAIGVGLAEIYIKNNGKLCEVEICIAKDAVTLMKRITNAKLKAEFKKLDRVRRELFPVLHMYGMADFDTLFECAGGYASLKMEKEEFYRVLYWHLKMRNEVQTADCFADNKPYAASMDVDMTRAMRRQLLTGTMFLYKACTREEKKLWSKGFCQVYDSWHFYVDFLVHGCRIDEEVCQRHIEAAFHAVRNGADIKELTELLLKIYRPRSANEYKEIWEYHMTLLMDTPICGLKGHGRQKLMESLGELPEELWLAPKEGLSEKQIKEDSHIYQMSGDIQERLYFVLDKDYDEGERILEALLAQTGTRNREMILYAAGHYACNGKFEKGYKLIHEALKTCGDADGSLKGCLQMLDHMAASDDDFDDGFMDGSFMNGSVMGGSYMDSNFMDASMSAPLFVQMPENTGKWDGGSTYRRETKKIGRNAPCPCGSGKKYKKCCGRERQ